MLKSERDEFFEDHLGSFQSIEGQVAAYYQHFPQLLDSMVERIYEALMLEYRAELNGVKPPISRVSESDKTLYANIRSVTEIMLGCGDLPTKGRNAIQPETLEDVVAMLKYLRKSVGFWTKQGGRQGYLTYVEGFFE